jgi:hypothetical protein
MNYSIERMELGGEQELEKMEPNLELERMELELQPCKR